ncbi:MAG: aldehyde dehydrogenase family protein [Rhodocyclaceae bacterium]|nr:aldehyde dehydrogenase family protein [Rhodocyclaceae bacterium]
MTTVFSDLTAGANDLQSDISRVFAAQRETALQWRTSTAKERIGRIRRLHDAVLDYRSQIHEAGFKDFRKPAAEVDLGEVMPIIGEARDAMRHLGKWMKPTRVMPTRMMLGSRSWIKHEPKGRSLIISPWNYPVNLALSPLVSSLAAGCPTILKPSELTPHLSGVVGAIVEEVFQKEEVAVFQGDAALSTRLLDLPFDHIFFTGSPAIGKVVMAAAAKHLTSVTLELGGKSPTIIDADADIRLAAQTVIWGKFTNNGQTCIAPDHVYVHASIKEAFVRECIAALQGAYGATAERQKDSPMLTRVVNARHTQRVASLLDDATARGARVLCGGEVRQEDCFIQPTLLDSVSADATIQREEIFGPLLPIAEFDDLTTVIDKINAQPKPLALYFWGHRSERIDLVLNHTSAGGTCINNCIVQYLHGGLPFGGVNNSGIGSAHGHFGFRAFSHERAVVRSYVSTARIFFPPYGRTTRRLLDLVLRIL